MTELMELELAEQRNRHALEIEQKEEEIRRLTEMLK